MIIKFLILQLLLSLNLWAKNLQAHVHGSVHLDIATDKNQLLIVLKSPAESFLGFEYLAKTPAEKALVKKLENQWKSELFNNLGAETLKDCKITKASWKQKFSGKSHSSILAEAYIQCENPLKNRLLHISFKKSHNRIKIIKLQLIREDGSVLNKEYAKENFSVKL